VENFMRSIENGAIHQKIRVSELLGPNIKAKRLLDINVAEKQTAQLGNVVVRTDIKSSLSPFLVLPEYRTQYPEVVTQALVNLYAEYNRAFNPLVKANREWDTDYQFCMTSNETPINRWVQIDMVGLPDGFMKTATNFNEEDVREALRKRIFEIENSLAMYQILENLFSNGQQDTLFKRQFRASLDALRERYGKPIALLAVTDQKYQAMKESEFGKSAEETLVDAEVMELSGFDRFFGPEEFKKYLEENRGKCDYLLYVRSSDPVAKLKKPDTVVENPLLENPDMRRIIKKHAITFNIDAPSMDYVRRINDTKAYMPIMGMGIEVCSDTDILSTEFAAHLSGGKPYASYGKNRLSPEFVKYLRSQGIDPAKVESGETALRAKPMKGAYGGYGHLRGVLGNTVFRKELRQSLRSRGHYVMQPEMQTPIITNESDGIAYTYIDRVFLSTINGTNYRFMGGCRSLMPLDSSEAKNGRNHGSKHTVYAEIS